MFDVILWNMVCGIKFHKRIVLEKKIHKVRYKIFMKYFRPLTALL